MKETADVENRGEENANKHTNCFEISLHVGLQNIELTKNGRGNCTFEAKQKQNNQGKCIKKMRKKELKLTDELRKKLVKSDECWKMTGK